MFRSFNFRLTMRVGCAILLIAHIIITLRSLPKTVKQPEGNVSGIEDYLINTPGCHIPGYVKKINYRVSRARSKETCGSRAIFVEKDGYNITFRIDQKLLNKHYKGNQSYSCCYRFVRRSSVVEQEDTHITYSHCTEFKTGTSIELKEEVVVVSCDTVPTTKLKGSTFYEDAYINVKKIKRNGNSMEGKKHWNVLILGVDTMSRGRLASLMPKTFSYFNKHGWLDYKGYTKVGWNTFPNMISFLTGKNVSTVLDKCEHGMDKCNDDMVWSKFKHFGYVTAFGEDDVRTPDTFTYYNGFRKPPTDHYMRPLYLTKETRHGNLVCTKQMPSAVHALKYVFDFVDSYKSEKFFGMFWLNSFSHSSYYKPSLLDEEVTILLDKFNSTGVLSRTFIYFLSDHGLRFGKPRLIMESYYEERLPMFFMRVPLEFQESYAQAYENLQRNQNRLSTPYDLHETFLSTLELSSGSVMSGNTEACPKCSSLFEEISENRTCLTACIPEKWCTCYNLIEVDHTGYGAARSIDKAVSYVQNRAKGVKTVTCTRCSMFKLKTVVRVHMYVDHVNNKTYYVTAFIMSPGDVVYEALIKEDEGGFHLVQPIKLISQYIDFDRCIVDPNDVEFCMCEDLADCPI